MFAASLVALSLISVSAADYAVHNVIVGGDALPNALLFQPETVSACAGDIVRFTFMRKNHTVTQTSFDSVCNPLLDPYTHDPVFDSGFRPVAANQTSDPYTLDYNVKNSDTVWMYCRQTGHCKQGMVFAINPPDSGDYCFGKFKEAAKAFGGPQSPSAATPTSDAYGGQTDAPVTTYPTTYESSPNSPRPTPVSPQEHRIIVGANGSLTFDPPSIKAAPYDTVVFEFKAKNHTATQSSFDAPCRDLGSTSTTGQKGFDSGFKPVNSSNPGDFPQFSVTVNDTAPIWVHCRQGTHCIQGMVFAVNADENSDHNFTAFVARAKASNSTSSNSSSNVQAASEKGAAQAIRPSMTSAALLVVAGLFISVL